MVGGLRRLLPYKKRYSKRHSRQGKRPEGYRYINERPIEAGERSEVGHTEIDNMIRKNGQKKKALRI